MFTRYPLLTAADEVALAQEIETCALAAWTKILTRPAVVREAMKEVASTLSPLVRRDVEGEDENDEASQIVPAERQRRAVWAFRKLLASGSSDPAQFLATDTSKTILMAAVRRWRWRDKGELNALCNQMQRAKDRFVGANTRLAAIIARPFTWTGNSFDDLLQEAIFGLLHAVDVWDWRRGFRFSTFASWWIRQAVIRCIHNNGSAVRLPVPVHEELHKMRSATVVLEQRLGRLPTDDELAVELGIKPRRVGQLRLYSAATSSVSLDVSPTTDDEDGKSRLDLLASHVPSAEEDLATRQVYTLFSHLDERSATVLRLRFGEEELTLEETGVKLGVTRERVRQIQDRALEELRRLAVGGGLSWEMRRRKERQVRRGLTESGQE